MSWANVARRSGGPGARNGRIAGIGPGGRFEIAALRAAWPRHRPGGPGPGQFAAVFGSSLSLLQRAQKKTPFGSGTAITGPMGSP